MVISFPLLEDRIVKLFMRRLGQGESDNLPRNLPVRFRSLCRKSKSMAKRSSLPKLNSRPTHAPQCRHARRGEVAVSRLYAKPSRAAAFMLLLFIGVLVSAIAVSYQRPL